MAAVPADKGEFPPALDVLATELNSALKPVPGQSLHFTVAGTPNVTLMPYWQVPWNQRFSCCQMLR